MIYREIPLPDAARPSAFCAWRFIVEDDDPPVIEHRIPPDGAANLVLIRGAEGQVMVRRMAPQLVAQVLPVMRGWTYAGVRLRPEAHAAITRLPPGTPSSSPLALDGEFASVWSDLLALIDGGTDWAKTTAFLAARHAVDPQVAAAVDLFVAGLAPTIAEAAAATGLSPRQFRRRFQAATGLSPRDYAGVQRARGALILSLTETSWAEVAHEAGYADQPHLARDIRGRYGGTLALVGGYFGAMRHELLTPAHGRFVQDALAEQA